MSFKTSAIGSATNCPEKAYCGEPELSKAVMAAAPTRVSSVKA